MQDSSSAPPIDEVVDAVLASSRALVALSARSIAGVKGVTLPQFRMLVVLSDAPGNLSQLARALDVAPSTAMRMIDRLEAAGFVVRAAAAGNRRETHLQLTAAGKRAVRTVLARRRRDLRAVVEHIPRQQHGPFTTAMAAFAAAADEVWGVKATSSV